LRKEIDLQIADAWYLTGPTASGKTTLGIDLAQRLSGEILSMDSMAVYQGLDIGTAKPTAAERKQVSHHLIDFVSPDATFSVAKYMDAAQTAFADVLARGKTPIFVGGTPLYLKTLLRGLFHGPPSDAAIREALSAELNEIGEISLHQKLAACDPRTAKRLHPADSRRVIRALEVFQLTGESITALQQQFGNARPAEHCRVICLNWPRDVLYQRINTRVEAMFAQGLVDEVRALLTKFGSLGHTAAQAVGYREVMEHLQGTRNLAETVSLVQQKTRQFAKRQMTWFRSFSECRWIDLGNDVNFATIADEVARSRVVE
jgi:tRNA dimethylallyltransferase